MDTGKPHESTAWHSLLKEEKSLLGLLMQPHTPDSHLVVQEAPVSLTFLSSQQLHN